MPDRKGILLVVRMRNKLPGKCIICANLVHGLRTLGLLQKSVRDLGAWLGLVLGMRSFVADLRIGFFSPEEFVRRWMSGPLQ
jgi:hypothetical protein